MSYQPGTHLVVTRTTPLGTVRLSGTVIEDYGYGLMWRDDQDGHCRHLATDAVDLAAYGVTQTITVA